MHRQNKEQGRIEVKRLGEFLECGFRGQLLALFRALVGTLMEVFRQEETSLKFVTNHANQSLDYKVQSKNNT